MLEFVAGALVAALTSLAVCGVLVRAGPIDHGDKSYRAHEGPTPTSGGLGMGVGFALGLLTHAQISREWRAVIDTIGSNMLLPAAMFALVFLMLGAVDDSSPLGPRLKLVLFSALAGAAAAQIGVVKALPLADGMTLHFSFAVGLIGTSLWVFTMVNAVNFMDGVNGLAMGSVAIGLLAIAVISQMLGGPTGLAVGLCGAGAIIGFLVWNFPSGRLFAGDAGSLFAGAVAAMCALIVVQRTQLSPFIPPLIFMPLLADVLLTLAWRASRRRSLLDGHSEHVFQIALRAGWSHARITGWYWLAMAICSVAAIVATRAGGAWPLIAFATAALAAALIASRVRRYALARGIAEEV